MGIDLDTATKAELIAYVFIRYRKEINPRESVETIRHRVKAIENHPANNQKTRHEALGIIGNQPSC